jgi:hypothetical protein
MLTILENGGHATRAREFRRFGRLKKDVAADLLSYPHLVGCL